MKWNRQFLVTDVEMLKQRIESSLSDCQTDGRKGGKEGDYYQKMKETTSRAAEKLAALACV